MYVWRFKIKRPIQIFVFIVFFVMYVVCASNVEEIKHRVKRKVMFTSSSKFFVSISSPKTPFSIQTFFLSLTLKNNVLGRGGVSLLFNFQPSSIHLILVLVSIER